MKSSGWLHWFPLLFLAGVRSQGPPGGAPGNDCTLILHDNVKVDNPEMLDTSEMVVDMLDEKTGFVNGSVRFPNGFPNYVIAKITVYKVENGRKEIVFTHSICKLCDYLGMADNDKYGEMKSILVPPCPFDAGTFLIKELMVDETKMPLSPNNAGIYDAEIKLIQGSADTPEEGCDDKDLPELTSLTITVTIGCM